MMKKLLLLLGMLYSILSMLFLTDLSPLLLWGPTAKMMNYVLMFLFNMHPGLIFLWLFSAMIIGMWCGQILKIGQDQAKPVAS